MAASDHGKFDCIIWGGYGFGNTGDEICLAVAVEHARQRFGNQVAILSYNPEYTGWLFPDVAVIPFIAPRHLRKPKSLRSRISRAWRLYGPGKVFEKLPFVADADWCRHIARSKLLYLTGGGYLSDLFNLDFLVAPIQFAQHSSIPVETSPVGVGPFALPFSAQIATSVLKRVKLVVRDEVSSEFCRSRGIEHTIAPDDAFAFLRKSLVGGETPSDNKSGRKIGVCIFRQYGQPKNCDWSKWWTQLLVTLKNQDPTATIEGFCFHTSLREDFNEMVHVFGKSGLSLKCVRPPEMDFRRAVAAVRDYDFILSTRFHAIVAANVFNIPNIAVASGEYYRAKMTAACRDQLHSLVIDPAETPPERLAEIYAREIESGR